MWQRATASNEIQDCEAIQVWEIIFWSSDPQRTAGYIRIIQRALKNADSWAQHLEVNFLHLGKGSEICILEKLVILWHRQVYQLWPTHFTSREGSRFALWEAGEHPQSPHFDVFWFQNHRRHHRGFLSPLDRSKCSFFTSLCRFQSCDSSSQDHATIRWRLLVILGTTLLNLSSFLWGSQSWRWVLRTIRLRPLWRRGDLREGHFPFHSSRRLQWGPWSLLGNPSVMRPRET